MNFIKKYCITILFAITASLTAGSVGAQAWSTSANAILPNPCTMYGNFAGTCVCPQGSTRGSANETNCLYDGAIVGCWNPVGVPKGSTEGTGSCNTCGTNNTTAIGAWACFGGINGQQTIVGESSKGPNFGIACSQNSQCQGYNTLCTGTNASGECISWGTEPTSGGYSTN